MTNYAYGWDYSWYNPADSTLTSNGVQFVCRYLSYDTTGKNIDAAEYTHLHGLGISVVLNWEYNTQAPKSGYSQGVSDATKAESLRQSIGAPANAPIYFSVDFDASPGDQTAIDQYLAGAASVIGHSRVGVYGSYYVVERCYASGSASWFWQTYAWSGGSISSHAHIHQFNNGIQSGNADEDHALKPEYGQIKPDGTVGSPTTGAFNMSATAHMSVSTGAPPPPVDPPPTVTVKDRPFLLADPRTIKLLVAGPDYRPLAPLTTWSSIEATPTLRDNGVGTLVIPADERIYNLLTGTGNRLHLYYQGRTWLCGPITTVEQPEEGGVPGQLTCTWVSDMTWLGRRLTYPSPSKESTDTTQPANYTATDIAETVLRNLVDLNIGPGALPARQKSGLVLETAHSPLLGSSVSVTAPMSQTLKDSLAAAAVASTPNLGFDLVLDDAVPQLVFRVWAPVDRSNRVRYTRGLNNVTSADVTSTMPTATVAIVGAEATTVTTDTSTEDTTEKPGKVWERSADADTLTAWGRQEVWVSSSADSEATQAAQDSQSQQDGDLAVLNGSYSVTVDAQVIDTPGRQYGVDYQLGDTVGYNPPLGEPITQVVQSVTLHAEPQTGVTVIPNFGDATPRMGKDLIGLVQQLQRRIARLEAG
jgi:hypothetical protein